MFHFIVAVNNAGLTKIVRNFNMKKLWLMQAAVRSCVLSELLKGHLAKGNFILYVEINQMILNVYMIGIIP